MSRSLSNDLNNPELFRQFRPGIYTYDQSDLGKSAFGQLTLASHARSGSAQTKAGGEHRRGADSPYGVDDGGHLIAARFGGSSELENLTAQDRNLNRQDFKRLENRWAECLADGSNKLFVNIEAYDRDGSGRPSCYMGYYIVEHTDENGAVSRTCETFSFLNESREQIASFQSPDLEDEEDFEHPAQAGRSPGAGGNSRQKQAGAGNSNKEGTSMAEVMNPRHYRNMIEALNLFYKNSLQTCRELTAACKSCVWILGEDDVASKKISEEAVASVAKLMELGEEARRIAGLMDEELQEAFKRTRDVWEDDGSTED